MPSPSSLTRMARLPPCSSATLMRLRAGVEAVFNQFLDHGSRAIDHFAGGDLVDQVVGEQADFHAR